ncbi:Metallo-dependent phosphatase-like protein [Tribonema minus]|uniref:Metallo-dependent phosphatase-like protein n=1 Tax=Tribonema minus TaxID=303371 RepID=A0A835Z6I0_9STRA|nr:Metallo-dependent phosphatase-like protein [Tribonema minus]
MRIHVVSDVHLEYGGAPPFSSLVAAEADVLVLAGDIAAATCPELPDFVARASEIYERVLYVPGNHEYYHSSNSMAEMRACLRAALDPFGNVTLLDDDVAEIGGVKFVGSTLWSRVPADSELEVSRCVNDYRFVRAKCRPISPCETTELHAESVDFLRRHCDADSVVITHHCPRTRKTSHPRYDGSSASCAFATDVSLPRMPRLWVSGHTHFNHDFQEPQGGTRFLSNQYRNENWRLPHSPTMTLEI